MMRYRSNRQVIHTDTQNYQSSDNADQNNRKRLVLTSSDDCCPKKGVKCCQVVAVCLADEDEKPDGHFKRQPGSFQMLGSEHNFRTWWSILEYLPKRVKNTSHKLTWRAGETTQLKVGLRAAWLGFSEFTGNHLGSVGNASKGRLGGYGELQN